MRAALVLLRRPRPTAGEAFHGLLDTGNVPPDLFQMQPSSDNLIVSDLEQGHSAQLKTLPVAAGARPVPFGPGRFTVLDRPADLGVEVGVPANMASQLARIWAARQTPCPDAPAARDQSTRCRPFS